MCSYKAYRSSPRRDQSDECAALVGGAVVVDDLGQLELIMACSTCFDIEAVACCAARSALNHKKSVATAEGGELLWFCSCPRRACWARRTCPPPMIYMRGQVG